MILTLFNNQKGLIHGPDPKRLGCDLAGVLRIGKTEIKLAQGEESVMPMLFQGSTGNYPATFEAENGVIYNLEKVSVRAGLIQPPPPTVVDVMELRCRLDRAEERLTYLDGIFDTNALNFII